MNTIFSTTRTSGHGGRVSHPPNRQHPQQQRQAIPVQGGVTQRSSIQDQFTSLTEERDKFNKEKELAENELVRVQAEYKQLKEEQEDFIKKNYEAQAELGIYSKKLVLLKDDETRLRRTVVNVTRAIQDCARHLKALEGKKEEADIKFINDMDPINIEVGMHLQKRTEKAIAKHISVRSVESVILPFIEAKKREGSPALAHGISGLQGSIDALNQASAREEEATKEFQRIVAFLKEKNVDAEALLKEGRGGIGNRALQEGLGQSPEDLFYGSDDEN
ncbi:MAG: hypothetical protein SGILL_003405 [Bacillariaceae sp.]